MKDHQEIADMADNAADAAMGLTKYHGMSYEEGVQYALEWVLDESDMSDDELM